MATRTSVTNTLQGQLGRPPTRDEIDKEIGRMAKNFGSGVAQPAPGAPYRHPSTRPVLTPAGPFGGGGMVQGVQNWDPQPREEMNSLFDTNRPAVPDWVSSQIEKERFDTTAAGRRTDLQALIHQQEMQKRGITPVAPEVAPPTSPAYDEPISPEREPSLDQSFLQDQYDIDASKVEAAKREWAAGAPARDQAEVDQERRERLKVLKGHKNIAEGLGKMGNFRSAAEIRLGIEKPADFKAETTRGEISKVNADIIRQKEFVRDAKLKEKIDEIGEGGPDWDDPTSVVSQTVRGLFKDVTGKKAEEESSADQLMPVIKAHQSYLESLSKRRVSEYEAGLGTGQGVAGGDAELSRYSVSKSARESLSKSISSFDSSALGAKKRSVLGTMAQARGALTAAKKDPQAIAGAITAIARASGEVGALSNKDREVYENVPGWRGLLAQGSKWLTGLPPQAQLDQLERTLNLFEEVTRQTIGAEVEMRVEREYNAWPGWQRDDGRAYLRRQFIGDLLDNNTYNVLDAQDNIIATVTKENVDRAKADGYTVEAQ